MGAMRLVLDRLDQGMPTEVGVDRLGELLADRENRLWLDISDPGAEEVALLRRAFGFHELVLEDVTRRTSAPGATPTPATTSSSSTPPNNPATRSSRGS